MKVQEEDSEFDSNSDDDVVLGKEGAEEDTNRDSDSDSDETEEEDGEDADGNSSSDGDEMRPRRMAMLFLL